LLSSHLLSYKVPLIDLDSDWPCDGPLLKLAVDVAKRLLPAFDTATGLPYGTVNLKYGVPQEETTVTCTASCGTFLLEFGVLSRLTGDPVFEDTALRATAALWDRRSTTGLVGNHIDVASGNWVALEAGIGGNIDSYYEYLLKGSILFSRPNLLHQFKEYYLHISRLLRHSDWYVWADMTTGKITWPVFQSLEAFWPGLQTLFGDIDLAARTARNYHTVWQRYGATPEFLHLNMGKPIKGREGYPLRPELVESAMYLYQSTKDKYWLEVGRDIVDSIEHISKVPCGYATVKNILNHELEDRMESFFLSETTKYLYLLFTPDHYLHKDASEMTQDEFAHLPVDPQLGCDLGVGGYIFNTEAHPINVGVLGCCHAPMDVLSRVHSTPQGKLLEEEQLFDHIEHVTGQQQKDQSEDNFFGLAETLMGKMLSGIPMSLSEQDLINLQHQIQNEILIGLDSNDNLSPSADKGVKPLSISISIPQGMESQEIVQETESEQSNAEEDINTFVKIVTSKLDSQRPLTFGSGFLWLMSNSTKWPACYGCVQRPYEEKFAKLAVPLMDYILEDEFNYPKQK
jgi:mannosidase alpha-like ER degradation enhancer 2